MAHESYDTFDAVKTRLDEIVDAVSSDELPLDDALVLYEEAVGLGLRASDLLETNIDVHASNAEADSEAAEELESDNTPESDQPVLNEEPSEEKAEV